MRIVIDLQAAQTNSRFRGIGRYALSFAQAVVRNRQDDEVLVVLNGFNSETVDGIRAEFSGALCSEKILVFHVPGPVKKTGKKNEARRRTAELVWEAFLLSLKPDVIHISNVIESHLEECVSSIGRMESNAIVSATLYDLIPRVHPEKYLDLLPDMKLHYFRKIKDLKKASLLLAISESAKMEGVKLLDIPEDRIVNISAGVDPKFRRLDMGSDRIAQLKSKFGIGRKMVMSAGGAEERNNIKALVDAFALISAKKRRDYQLVLLGKMTELDVLDMRRHLSDAGLGPDDYCFTGYVSDEELVELFNICELFVFPSWHEGFGLPPLEAMSCGAPVIVANATSLPEVIELEEAMFDPFDVEKMSAKMQDALFDDDFRNVLKANSLRQPPKFTWDQSARVALAAWRKAHNEKRPNAGSEIRRNGQSPPDETPTEELLNLIAQSVVDGYELKPKDLKWTASAIDHNEREAARVSQFSAETG